MSIREALAGCDTADQCFGLFDEVCRAQACRAVCLVVGEESTASTAVAANSPAVIGLTQTVGRSDRLGLVTAAGDGSRIVVADATEFPRYLATRPFAVLAPLDGSIHGLADRLNAVNFAEVLAAVLVRVKDLLSKTVAVHQPLSPRAQECLQLISQGLSSKEAALRLDITPQCVDFHILNVCRKLGAANRTHAVALAVRHHLIEVPAASPAIPTMVRRHA